MTNAMKAVIAAGVVFLTLILLSVASYVSYANQGNRLEKQLLAKVADNENILSSGYQQVTGVVQVTSMATEDQMKVFTAAIQGRYGADGSKAVFQMLKESNPQLDPQLYREVQKTIKDTQKEFQNGQTGLQDVRRSYETQLDNVWGGFWLSLAGYPKVDMKKFDIVSTDAASDAFRTKKQKPMNLAR